MQFDRIPDVLALAIGNSLSVPLINPPPPHLFVTSCVGCPPPHSRALLPGAGDANQSQQPVFNKCVSDSPYNSHFFNSDLSMPGDEQQERTERVEQAKEKIKDKALATRRANLINTHGDELMYSPAKHYTAPTITGSASPDIVC